MMRPSAIFVQLDLAAYTPCSYPAWEANKARPRPAVRSDIPQGSRAYSNQRVVEVFQYLIRQWHSTL